MVKTNARNRKTMKRTAPRLKDVSATHDLTPDDEAEHEMTLTERKLALQANYQLSAIFKTLITSIRQHEGELPGPGSADLAEVMRALAIRGRDLNDAMTSLMVGEADEEILTMARLERVVSG